MAGRLTADEYGWFSQDPNDWQDLCKSAERAAGRSQQPQRVHWHTKGGLCNPRCVTIEPGSWPPGQDVHTEPYQHKDPGIPF